MTRNFGLMSAAAALSLVAARADAQELQDRTAAPPPPPTATSAALPDDQVEFSAGQLEYENDSDVVTATGDVRMFREGQRLRADKVVWNRKTGGVVASGNIAVVNEKGDTAYGDTITLTDTLKDGVVDNMLVVLAEGGRLAAKKGTRDGGVYMLDYAAYTPCPVKTGDGCPKEPTWKITAVRIVYNPDRKRIFYEGARFNLFGLEIPLPPFSNAVGDDSDGGFLSPDLRYNAANGLSFSLPYYWNLGPNRGLTVTPRVFTNTLPMLGLEYRALTGNGAYRVTGYGTYSRRSDDFAGTTNVSSKEAFRGYLDAAGRFQFDPEWSATASFRVATDKTFLRRYDISSDDRLRNMLKVERIDRNSYLSITGWATQSMRLDGRPEQQPIAVPEVDYRRRFEDVAGGLASIQLNTLALTRTDGQDTQRAFAAGRWDLRRLTNWGQELLLTAYGRADVYNAHDTLATTTALYRGEEGFHTRVIGALAAEVRWPLIGTFGSGTQRITPRIQLVGTPHTANLRIPNEDARAVDLEDSNLFALNRFPGYDRWEDASRLTYGIDWAIALRGFTLDANVGQSYRIDGRDPLFPNGTGLTGRLSDIVGRTELRFRDFVSITHRYRLDKNDLAVRRNEIDATVGSRSTYALIGYLRLNRDIGPTLEDLQDREELRVGGRAAFAKYWSVYGTATIDLTDRSEDVLSQSDGFDPVRHRVGVAYQDDCLRLGLTWKRDYQRAGDARKGNSFMLSLAFRNLGR